MKYLTQALLLLSTAVLVSLTSCNHHRPAKDANTAPPPTKAVNKNTHIHSQKVTTLTINLEEILTKANAPKAQKVVVKYDQVHKTQKEYMGYSLKELIKPYVDRLNTPDNHMSTLVTFVCSDGYKPNRNLNDLLANDGYLVFRDLAQPKGKNWAGSLTKKYAPYYLVWKDLAKEDKSMAWPYGLVQIKFNTSAQAIFNAIVPKNKTMMTGFNLFKQHCITCHSLNKVGGNLGPDLNYPKNILEYWDKEHVKGFIANPKSYRYNSKMAQLAINAKEIDQIVGYLEEMQRQKID